MSEKEFGYPGDPISPKQLAMRDKEYVEIAAKLLGIHKLKLGPVTSYISFDGSTPITTDILIDLCEPERYWNPLKNPNDLIELITRLGIKIEIDHEGDYEIKLTTKQLKAVCKKTEINYTCLLLAKLIAKDNENDYKKSE